MAETTGLMITISGAILAFSVVIAYAVFHIYEKYRRASSGWKSIAAASFLMVLDRLVVFLFATGWIESVDLMADISSALFFLIFASFAHGIWKVKGAINDYELVERRVLERLVRFEKAKKGRSR